MNKLYGISAALIGAAIAIVQPQIAAALSTDEVQNIAKKITVLIPEQLANGGEANGSGSIIAKEGNTYTVLTANHVVCKDQNDVCQTPRNGLRVIANDGQEYPINFTTVKKLPGVDLAVLQFTSDKNYKLATLGNYELAGEQFIFASGWPDPKFIEGKRERHFNIGKILPKDITPLFKIFPVALGYEMVYTSITYGGMSGGPVLDSEGRVIAVHGQNEGVRIEGVRVPIGFSVAIPIGTFLKGVTQIGIQRGWSVENSPPNAGTLDEIGDIYNQDFENIVQTLDEKNTNPIDWLMQGNKMWRLGQLQFASAAYEKAIQLNPQLYQAWYGKALVMTSWKKPQEAIAAYDQVLQLNSDDTAAKLQQKLKQSLGISTPAQSQPPAVTNPLPETSAPTVQPPNSSPQRSPQTQPIAPSPQPAPAEETIW